jgi:hypothetical protein
MFGYAAAVSDIQVTWADGSTSDCLLKVYPVSPNMAAGFSGSVQAGFWMLRDITKFLSAGTSQNICFPVRSVAIAWHRRARYIHSRMPPSVGRLSIMLLGVSPIEDVGIPGLARPDVVIFDSADGFEPNFAARGKAVSIGAGSEITEYTEALEKTVADPSHFQLSAMGPPGGAGWHLAFSMSHTMRESPRSGISSLVLYTIVRRGQIATHPHEFTEIEPDGTRTEFRLPWIAKSWNEFAQFARRNGRARHGAVG